MDIETESWLPIPCYEGLYSVSSFGRVRSEPRVCRHPLGGEKKVPGRVLRPYVMKSGYHIYDLRKDNKGGNHYAHRLVLNSFVGPAPSGTEARHNNGERGDNRLSNLRWDTRKANHADKHIHGTSPVGERSPSFKLTDEQVRSIRSDSRASSAIAAEHGVSWGVVCAIRRGDQRRHTA